MARTFFVYILASRKGGTLYVGVTNDLSAEFFEHKSDAVAGFTRRYQVHRLVYFEPVDSAEAAISREKQLKAWKRLEGHPDRGDESRVD